MIYEFWYRVSRTVFPFISLKRYHEICDDYDFMIDSQSKCIDSQAATIQDLRDEIDSMRYHPLPPLDNFRVITALPMAMDSFENIKGKSVDISGVFPTDDEDIARMDNEGPVNPAQWGKD